MMLWPVSLPGCLWHWRLLLPLRAPQQHLEQPAALEQTPVLRPAHHDPLEIAFTEAGDLVVEVADEIQLAVVVDVRAFLVAAKEARLLAGGTKGERFRHHVERIKLRRREQRDRDVAARLGIDRRELAASWLDLDVDGLDRRRDTGDHQNITPVRLRTEGGSRQTSAVDECAREAADADGIGAARRQAEVDDARVGRADRLRIAREDAPVVVLA